MLIYDTLDRLAKSSIPSGKHEFLHVDSRQAWVETVVSMYERGMIDPRPLTIKSLLSNWEQLLYKKYSHLN